MYKNGKFRAIHSSHLECDVICSAPEVSLRQSFPILNGSM